MSRTTEICSDTALGCMEPGVFEATPVREKARKRIHTFDSDDDGGLNDSFILDHPQIYKAVTNPSDYVHIMIPRTLEEAFRAFLTTFKQATTNVTRPEEISTGTDTSTNISEGEFIQEFDKILKSMLGFLKNMIHSQIIRNLDEDDLSKFKEYRSLITQWYSSCLHFKRNLLKVPQDRNFISLDAIFSPSVASEKVKNFCNKEVAALKTKLESEVASDLLRILSSRNSDMGSLWSNMGEKDKFLFGKAFRAVLLNNREISKDFLMYIPKNHEFKAASGRKPNWGQRPQGNFKPSYRQQRLDGNHNRHSFRDGNDRHRGERDEGRYYREDSRGYYGYQRDRDIEGERRERPYYDRDQDYERDFPEIDRNYHQKKSRYADKDHVGQDYRRYSDRDGRPWRQD